MHGLAPLRQLHVGHGVPRRAAGKPAMRQPLGHSTSLVSDGVCGPGTPAEAVVQGQQEEHDGGDFRTALVLMMGKNPLNGDWNTAALWAAEAVRRCAVPGPGGHGAVLLPLVCALPQVPSGQQQAMQQLPCLLTGAAAL